MPPVGPMVPQGAPCGASAPPGADPETSAAVARLRHALLDGAWRRAEREAWRDRVGAAFADEYADMGAA
jgi:hypothetical protein